MIALTLILPGGGGLKYLLYIFSWEITPLCGIIYYKKKYKINTTSKFGTLCSNDCTMICLFRKFENFSLKRVIISMDLLSPPPLVWLVFENMLVWLGLRSVGSTLIWIRIRIFEQNYQIKWKNQNITDSYSVAKHSYNNEILFFQHIQLHIDKKHN